jgi:hypothetical protein
VITERHDETLLSLSIAEDLSGSQPIHCTTDDRSGVIRLTGSAVREVSTLMLTATCLDMMRLIQG